MFGTLYQTVCCQRGDNCADRWFLVFSPLNRNKQMEKHQFSSYTRNNDLYEFLCNIIFVGGGQTRFLPQL